VTDALGIARKSGVGPVLTAVAVLRVVEDRDRLAFAGSGAVRLIIKAELDGAAGRYVLRGGIGPLATALICTFGYTTVARMVPWRGRLSCDAGLPVPPGDAPQLVNTTKKVLGVARTAELPLTVT